MKTATISPAFSIMKIRISDQLQIALQVEIVDEVRAGAEDEQPAPDHQIELDRMLLMSVRRHALAAALHRRGRGRVRLLQPCLASSPQIEEREDEHPDQIDEVPVQADDLDDLVVAPCGW